MSSMSSGTRIPLRFGPLSGLRDGEAVLLPHGSADDGCPEGVVVQRFNLPPVTDGAHPAACACCVPRGPAASALAQLYFARVRGELAFFSAVLAANCDARAEAAIREAIRRDPLVGSRYRAALAASL